MEKDDFRRLLQSVGVETFVKYFDVFKANSNERSNTAIKEAFVKGGENWTSAAINTKASIGKRIFQLEKEEEALNYIINGASAAVKDQIRENAKKLDEKRLVEQARELCENNINYDNKILVQRFRNRLKTQDRSKNKDKFPTRRLMTLFKKEKFFKEWINKQVDRVIVLSEKKEFRLDEIKAIYRIADGTWRFDANNGSSFDLFTETATDGEPRRAMEKNIPLRDIVLDHVISMKEILESNKNKLPILMSLDSLKDECFNDIKADLKKELLFLDCKISLQLMESGENTKKRDNGSVN